MGFYMKRVLLMMILFFSSKSFCMVCVDSNNSVSDTVSINNPVLVSESANIGDVIWSSPEITTTVTCNINKGESRDNVYVYSFPTFDSSTLPAGVSLRLIINGETISNPVSGQKQLLTPTADWTVPSAGYTGVVTSQLVLIKSASTIENKDLGTIPLYQLDGNGGLNGANSLRVSLTGLSNIVGVTCTSAVNTLSQSSSLSINDDLIDSGKAIAAIANIAVSCSPVASAKNKTLTLSVLPSSSYDNQDGSFKTNRDGLLYELIVGTTSINASSSDNSITLALDSSGNGTMPVYQKLTLTNNMASWLYDKSITTATSNSVKLTTKVKVIN